jgi:hypothetical protein
MATKTPRETAQELLASDSALPGFYGYQCECTFGNDIDLTYQDVAEDNCVLIIEHAWYDHLTPRSIYRTTRTKVEL